MKNTWLAFLTIGFFTVVTFIFFFLRTQPIKLPELAKTGANEKIEQPVLTFVNPAKGPVSAPVTIVTYGDFQCESCAQMASTIEAVRLTQPEKIRVVWKNFPNESLHPESTPSAIAAHCADRQGAFWPYHDQLFVNRETLAPSLYPQLAEQLGLDVGRFNECVKSQDTLAIVQKDFEEARALGLSATPATYVGTQVFVGATDAAALTKLVNEQLP